MQNGAPLLWAEVRAAIEDAVASFNEHYPQYGGATCEIKNGQRVLVTLTRPADRLTRMLDQVFTAEAAFDPGTNAKISCIQQGRDITKLTFYADEDGVKIVSKGSYISPDEASQIILEPLLFPKPH